jgi:hypothetical protein
MERMWSWKAEITRSRILGALMALAAIGTASLATVGCGKGPDGPDSDSSAGFGGDTTIDPGISPSDEWHFKITGHGSATSTDGRSLKALTDTTLKVRIKAGAGGSFGFNCELFRVTVGNMTKSAFVKKTNYQAPPSDPCAGAATSWTADFSNALAPGHGDVSIQIDGAMYDNCRLQGGYGAYYGGCTPLIDVYGTHTVDGNLEVFTN